MILIANMYHDARAVLIGRVECGTIREDDNLLIMPCQVLSSIVSFDFFLPSVVFLSSF